MSDENNEGVMTLKPQTIALIRRDARIAELERELAAQTKRAEDAERERDEALGDVGALGSERDHLRELLRGILDWLDRPDVPKYEYYKIAPGHVARIRAALATPREPAKEPTK